DLGEQIQRAICITFDGGLVRRACVAIFEPLAQREFLPRPVSGPEPDGPIQEIVSAHYQGAFAVPVLDHVADGIQYDPAETGVDAFDTERAVREVIDVAEGDSVERITDSEDVAPNVVSGTGAKFFHRRQWI